MLRHVVKYGLVFFLSLLLVSTALAEAPGKTKPVQKTSKPDSGEELPPGFKVIPGAGPPGTPASDTPSASEAKMFKVIPNAPPPGGPVKTAPGEAEKFQVVPNAPPPGGPVNMTEEEKALFGGPKERTPPAP